MNKSTKTYSSAKSQRDLKSRLDKLKSQFKNDRSSFESHWSDLAEYYLPNRYRLHLADQDHGRKKRSSIIDSTASFAIDTLRSGLMSGVTSPARSWFKLAIPDKKLNKNHRVKKWLADVEDVMRYQFVISNLYNVLPNLYADLGTFSTGCMLMEKDNELGMRFYSLPVGSFWIANDAKMRPRKFMRELKMSTSNIVEKFAKKDENGQPSDWSNISESVKSAYENNDTESWHDITHFIIPNPEHKAESPFSIHKKYLDVYYENNQEEGKDCLRKSGMDFFPVLCPRWEVVGHDVYGTDGPGMRMLGDTKQLQYGEKRTLDAIDKMIDPAMVGAPELKNAYSSIMSGDITYVSDPKNFRAAHEVRYDLGAMENKQAQVRQRINKGFYADLFLMLANSDRRNITATEISERKEEKLLALGPVLEQINQDLLDPLIDNTFAIMNEMKMFPEPPQEIEGLNLKVEYVSIMAQAQKLAGIGANDRLLSSIGQVAQFDPSAVKKLNAEGYVDVMADLLGSDPRLIRGDDEIAEINQAEAQAAAVQEAQAQEAQELQNMKTLSETKTDGGNALADLTSPEGASA